MCVYVCMHACMFACMHACMYACMYVCKHVGLYAGLYVCVCVSVYVCECVSMYVCMYDGCDAHPRPQTWVRHQGQSWHSARFCFEGVRGAGAATNLVCHSCPEASPVPGAKSDTENGVNGRAPLSAILKFLD